MYFLLHCLFYGNFIFIALKFIECMCRCGLPLSFGDPVLDMWQSVVEDNLPHAEETIRVFLFIVCKNF